MSLFSAIILPEIEKHLVEAEPEIADFAVKQLHAIGQQLVAYAENKLGMHEDNKLEEK